MGIYYTVLKRRKDEYKYLYVQEKKLEARGQLLYSKSGYSIYVIVNVIEPGIIEVMKPMHVVSVNTGALAPQITDDFLENQHNISREWMLMKRSGNCYKPAMVNEKGNYVFKKASTEYTICYK